MVLKRSLYLRMVEFFQYIDTIIDILYTSLINFLFPPTCVICDEPLATYSFCSKCWKRLELLDSPACPRCYFQFPFEVGSKCQKCEKNTYYCDAIRSPIRYNEIAKTLLLKFKNNNQTHLSSVLVGMMLRLLPQLEFDCIVAVPLHRFKRIWRGYNQAELLARGICRATGIVNLSHLLIRNRFTSSQRNFGKSDRANNVKNAFEATGSFYGMKVLLVDDVCTTGATIEECAKQLKNAGAERVYSITAAMT